MGSGQLFTVYHREGGRDQNYYVIFAQPLSPLKHALLHIELNFAFVSFSCLVPRLYSDFCSDFNIKNPRLTC